MSERTIYLEDAPLAVARERFARAIAPLLARALPEEEIDLEAALGRVTARPVFARLSSPHYHACAMDGIAVRAADTRSARETAPVELQLGVQAHWVDTGDPLPEGTDAVVMVEHVEERGERVAIRAAVSPYHHVRGLGEDIVASEAVVPSRRVLAAADLAAIAAAGLTRVAVVARPIVAILTTGDELVAPETPAPAKGAIVDSNGVLLAALVQDYGGVARRLARVADTVSDLRAALDTALHMADVVIVNAGSSAGSADHTAAVFRAAGDVVVHGVAIRPGHPVILGSTVRDGQCKALLGIPGYPVSAAICAQLFLAPLLAALGGRIVEEDIVVEARVARKLFSPLGEDEYVRAVLARVHGELIATPLRRGAGVITSLSRANALVIVPANSEGVQAGERVQAHLLRPRSQVERTMLAVGSHDVALDLLAGVLAERGIEFVSANVGSIAGLVALADRATHVAGTHVLDAASGTYNAAAVRQYVPGTRVALLHFAMREQGLIVARSNPLGLRTIADVVSHAARYINRQKDAGTRMLLDALLARAGLQPSAVNGYERLEFTHLAVAALVAEGSADAGLGIRAAARALGCDFVPVAQEPYELAMRADDLDDPSVAMLLEALRDRALRDAVERLGGYDMSAAGTVRVIE